MLNAIKTIMILVMAMLFCDCSKAPETKHIERKPKECQACKISEKCLALLAYGLLSDDKFDVPFGGACKDIAPDCVALLTYELLSDDEIDIPVEPCKEIASDSIAKFLQLEKNIFKRWQKDRVVDAKEITSNMGINTDIKLLHWLIGIRLKIGPISVINDKSGDCDDDCEECGGYKCAFDWDVDAGNVLEIFGGDYSFIWKLQALGYFKKLYLNIDTLTRISEFMDYAAYLDTSLKNAPQWCCDMKKYAQELKKYSEEDFFIKYYDRTCPEINCLLKPSMAIDVDMITIDGSRSIEDIMLVAKARLSGLIGIYNKHLNLKQNFSGNIAFKFIIAASGDIVNISIVSSTTGYPEFDNAIKNMVATWKWKAIQSGNTTVIIPFNFVE